MPDIATVISLVPFPIKEEKPGLYPPRYEISASDTEQPEFLTIKQGYHFVYVDETRGSLRIPTAANEIARSIVDDYCSAQLGVAPDSKPGIGWVEGRDFSDAFIEDLKRKQKRWFLALCRIADNDFKRYQQHNVISETQRIAAKFIGWTPEDHPWMTSVQEQSTHCRFCGTSIMPFVVVCPQCHNVLDQDKYEEMKVAR